MKHLKRGLLILLAIVAFNNVNAQDEDNPWAIDIGTNAVDFYPTGADWPLPYPVIPENPENPYLGGFGEDFFNVNDHWNTASVISRIRVGRYIGAGFGIGLAGSFNKIDKIGNYDASDLSYFGLDMDIRWNFLHGWFDPYLLVGGGYTWLDEVGNGTLNGGLGINFWFNDFIGANVQTMYKHSFDDADITTLPHFQHALGLNFKFGGKDTDGDGIYDKYDDCPEVAGLEAFNGCPDSDLDGIKDSEDACPNTPGLAEFNGCPDTDGDGIEDAKDACPEVAGVAEFNGCADTDGDGVADPKDNCVDVPGLKELNGCPDTDKDGITDAKDGCPQEAGPAANNGCPWSDKDGDSVLDKDDQCPDVAGTVANNGCPEVTQEVQNQLNAYAKTILFDSGKSSFQSQTLPVLASMNAIFKDYPTAKFALGGYTDSYGSLKSNQLLSERRVNAVRDWFVANGINAERLSATGFGEANPIDSNKTRAGRANNRRVEVRLVK